MVTEYPAPHELPDELRQRLASWGRRAEWAVPHAADAGHRGSAYYRYEHSAAPGWKVGGRDPWSFSDPWPMSCDNCGAEYRPC